MHAQHGRQANGEVNRGGERVEPGARVVVPARLPGDRRTDWPQILTAAATVLTSIVTVIVVSNR